MRFRRSKAKSGEPDFKVFYSDHPGINSVWSLKKLFKTAPQFLPFSLEMLKNVKNLIFWFLHYISVAEMATDD